jgi:hypothetical protein
MQKLPEYIDSKTEQLKMTSYISMQKLPEYTVFIKKLTSYINEKNASK